MIWDSTRWDADLRAFYQKLIGLRRTSPALIEGCFQVLLIKKDILAYMRDTDEEQIIVIGNRSSSAQPTQGLSVRDGGIADGTIFKEVFSEQVLTVIDGYIPLTNIPAGVQVWQSEPQRGK